MLRRLAVVICVFAVHLPAFCQMPVPQGLTMTVSPKVSKVAYNPSVVVEAKSGHQQATFNCAVVAAGYPVGTEFEYSWGPVYNGIDAPPEGIVLFRGADTYLSTANGEVYSAGEYTVTCSVIVKIPGEPPSQPILVSRKCWAVGGPLEYVVFQGGPSGDGVVAPVGPEHDSGSHFAPWYLQAFSYNRFDPDNLPGYQGLVDPFVQRPQYGAVAIPGQPEGTTVTWSVQGAGVAVRPGSDAPDSATLYLTAVSGTASGAIKVRVTFHFVSPEGDEYSGPDDSDETPPPGAGPSETHPEYYSFTGHAPNRVDIAGLLLGSPYAVTPQGPTSWTWQYQWEHKLYDNNGVPMNAVWIIERFPNYLDEIANSGYDLSTEFGTTGNYWTTKRMQGQDGRFDKPDIIGLQDVPFEIPFSESSPGVCLTQIYYGATRNPGRDPQTGQPVTAWGLRVATFLNSMWTNKALHEKQG